MVCLLCKMRDVWILVHLSFLHILLSRKRNIVSFVYLLLLLLAPTLAAPNKTAVINVHRAEKLSNQPQLSAKSVASSTIIVAENIRGKFSELGNVKEAEGRLHLVNILWILDIKVLLLFYSVDSPQCKQNDNVYKRWTNRITESEDYFFDFEKYMLGLHEQLLQYMNSSIIIWCQQLRIV